ncbi:MAG TPA: S8 family serine peptidase, partial [Chloroflexota bacterium]|nr:S8 family serine peptidase [Chloroflexota bacterium]
MKEVKFGRKDEPAIKLRMSDDLLAVRTRSTRSLRAGPVASEAAAEVADGDLVLAFPEAGVEVYRVPTGAGRRSLGERKTALRQAPDVRFAGGVLVDDTSGEPVVYTENLFVKFVDGADPESCRAVLREAGLTIKQEVDYATNAFFVAAPEGTGTDVFDIAARLLRRDDVEYCHPEVLRRRRSKAVFARQWHLKTTTIENILVAASASVEAAHQVTRGAGVTIAVIDDGVDVEHPEFNTPGKVVAPRDATLSSDDPRPKSPGERHGTACAGVACADGRDGASGVAPEARLMPIRLSSALGSLQEGSAFRWAADHGADVISCSWGPEDGAWFTPGDPLHNQQVPLPAFTRLAIDYATTQGRGGKGCVVLFAAGNGNESVDNDGYASYEKVIAVAACNDRGTRSVYSDFGAAVWCAFPSNDFAHAATGHQAPLTTGIWTTDRSGPAGYNSGRLQLGDLAGNYTNSFGGTSSACPGAAGVAALILAVNPALQWQEVRDLLKRSCDRIDPQGGAYDAAGRSALYGFGRLNAAQAVQLARPAPTNRVTIVRTFNQPLPDLQTVSVAVDVVETQPVADLAVQVDLRHTFIGDLVVSLAPPAGAAVVLHNRAGGATQNLKRTYNASTTPALARFAGASARGRWTLKVEDRAARDSGTLVSFGLDLTLTPAPPAPPPHDDRVADGGAAPAKRARA